MNYSHIFSSYVPNTEKLEAFGFFEAEGADNAKIFCCKKDLPASGFSADFTLNLEKSLLDVHVFDEALNERYDLFDVSGAQGTFVGEIREQVQHIVDDFCKTCCTSADLHNDYGAFIKRRFSVLPEFPWREETGKGNASLAGKFGVSAETLDDSAVFRCPNGKWFALVMNITYKQMWSGLKVVAEIPGFSEKISSATPFSAVEDKVWCVNLKAAPDEIPSLIDAKSIFPAYHMNKKHWITVALTAVTDFEKLCQLTEQSFSLVNGKAGR